MKYTRPNMHLSSTTPPSDYEWNVTDESEVRQLVTTVATLAAQPCS